MNPDCDSGKLRSYGLCLGASTISLVAVELNNCADQASASYPEPRIVAKRVQPHGGDPQKTLRRILADLAPFRTLRIAVTGRKFRQFLNLSAISEPEAIEYAYRLVKPRDVACPAVVSAGGETFMVYVLDRMGQISNVITGNKCASGTGEFFLQQLRRMDVSLAEAARWTATADPYRVSGRCSVFCKSDCTHATNKGVPKSKVTAGLCKMMANKILELLKKVDRRNIMIVGGTTQNRMMIAYLQKQVPGLIVPKEAAYFEALGAALWALENTTRPLPAIADLFRNDVSSFDRLPPLHRFSSQVEFKSIEKNDPRAGDHVYIGLDVGSTTTKAVLLRKEDNAILASVYLRTNGDPITASRQCYRQILDQVSAVVDPRKIKIEGLGVCGSGRQIAGLHALTDGVINEIIAHATASVYFDPAVDTIFEIGGQDAKYTYITNGVPSDYAMNEACSAGTGSFLEESAYETLGVQMEDIADIALQGQNVPNFNDQCAAFIASDIKNAIHEGVGREDITAGLVYSICMNYANRVKGNRPVGNKIFMQGGVCYNRGVPLAMAALVGKPIVVPPEPGLMGAFGVALEVKKRVASGLMQKKAFDLAMLAERTVTYGRRFTCKGGKEKCDRRCEIAMIELDGSTYPFGGACNRYDNLRRKVSYDVDGLDRVRLRQRMTFSGTSPRPATASDSKIRGRIGFNRSFLVNTYYPLYASFFAQLGLEPVLPATYSRQGIDQRNAAFCFPAELAHGYFHELLNMEPPPEYLFLPHFRAVPTHDSRMNSQVCPIVQGETYILRATFREQLDALRSRGSRMLAPLIDLTNGLEGARRPLIETARQMGIGRGRARRAFDVAFERQQRCLDEMLAVGRQTLADIEKDPDRFAVVLFGRPYSAFVDEAHMGIPHKLASRGVAVIPLDFLPLTHGKTTRHMYWGIGQLITKAARIVKEHPQLFAVYITNFSCGPDSFLLGYFRSIMGRKPSLTLELDSHTADAGLETRIEAFLDIVAAYRKLMATHRIGPVKKTFTAARTLLEKGVARVVTSTGEKLDMTNRRVTLLFPSMGRLASECLAAVFQGKGFNAKAYPPATEADLKTGRANTSCKECLPLILTTGTLLNYVRNEKKPDEVLVYFMAGGSGPCRFGQYSVFMENLIQRLELPDVALLTLSSENAYAGLGTDFQRRGWWAIVVSDVLEDIRSMLLANADDIPSAMTAFEEELELILKRLQQGDFKRLEERLEKTAERLRRIKLKRPPVAVPKIFLAGEIFVRRDALSRQYLTERLAEQGFATICSPVSEWMLYADFLVKSGRADCKPTLLEYLKFLLHTRYKGFYEKRIKTILAGSQLVPAETVRMDAIIDGASRHLSPELGGEAILTIGSALAEIVDVACGVIAIGPFGCMPNRLSEAILCETMNRSDKLRIDPRNEPLRSVLSDIDDLPFLAIESDGSPFPQIITTKLEAFCLRARRLHDRLYTMN
ncbi:MAG: acyl-CoA dehydratase activase [Desulfobacterales bacterium]